ncbi:MAG TPA: acyltransferase [Spirochaetota bacterium]|nr:acyltransferase [Spirochaetota bacterium]
MSTIRNDEVKAANDNTFDRDFSRWAGHEHGLDGLRGIAALSVVIWHFINFFLDTRFPEFAWCDHLFSVLERTPLAAIWGGPQAVMLFFVLSGYALFRMMDSLKELYLAYYIRRFFRLWVPYFFSVLVGFLFIFLFGNEKSNSFNPFYNLLLGYTITARDLLDHAIMITNFSTWKINALVWSLVHEMRLSLVFPAVYLAIRRWGSAVVLLMGICVAFYAIYYIHPKFFAIDHTSIRQSMIFQLNFVVGASIALHVRRIKEVYCRIPALIRKILALAAIILYSNPFPENGKPGILLASGWFVVMAVSSKSTIRFFEYSIVQFLGKISYSLYLFHLIIFLACIKASRGFLTPFQSMVVAVPLVLIISTLVNRYLELPANALGKRISRLIFSKRTTEQESSAGSQG